MQHGLHPERPWSLECEWNNRSFLHGSGDTRVHIKLPACLIPHLPSRDLTMTILSTVGNCCMTPAISGVNKAAVSGDPKVP